MLVGDPRGLDRQGDTLQAKQPICHETSSWFGLGLGGGLIGIDLNGDQRVWDSFFLLASGTG